MYNQSIERVEGILKTGDDVAAFPHDPGAAEKAILDAWQDDAPFWLPPELQPPPWPASPPGR
ncbi:MAG: ATP-binding protein, partial [Cyanobacteria bacterium P01_G01_bin.38]